MDISKYVTSLDFTHSRVVQIFVKGLTVFLWFFAAELVAGEGDAGRPASCLAVMRSCWQIGLGVLVPAGPLSWGFLSAFSSVGSLQAPSSCLYCNYSTVKCTLLANCDTGEFGNPHSYVYSTNKC